MDSSSIVLPYPYGNHWQCVKDPNGLFLGGVFRQVDLHAENEKERAAHWAEGMVFQSLDKPCRVKIVKGRIQSDTDTSVVPDKSKPGQGDSLTGEGNQHD
jgi:hypothetical protein